MPTAPSLPRLGANVPDGTALPGPAFDRSRLQRRVLHIGPGAFFRAHQADYFDRLNQTDPQWGITGLSLRSPTLAARLAPQDGLYTLAILDTAPAYRIIGSLLEVRHAGEENAIDAFLEPDLVLITLTVTEKGYCLASDGRLDRAHPDIQADIAAPQRPVSAPGWIVHGLALRRAAGLAPPVVLSCDNLPGNGQKLRAAVLDLAAETDPELAGWIAAHCAFPDSMVDSITPATDDKLVARVAGALHIEDAAPVQREAFTDWVISKVRSHPMPPLEQAGARFTDDVEAFEQAKLRLLNGAHSTLAYAGLAKGHETVADAIADPEIRALIAGMMQAEIAPTLRQPDGMDLAGYQDALIRRFANPAIGHKLSQIAWDGSKKLPIRLLATASENLAAGRPIDGLATGVAAWWRFVIRQAANGQELIDPDSERLTALARKATGDRGADIALLLSLEQVFPASLSGSVDFRRALASAYARVMAMEAQAAPTS